MNEIEKRSDNTDETSVQKNALKNISSSDKDKMLLASLYFYAKHRRKGRNFIKP